MKILKGGGGGGVITKLDYIRGHFCEFRSFLKKLVKSATKNIFRKKFFSF